MIARHLIFVGPDSSGRGLPNRPEALWAGLSVPGVFETSMRVERARPHRYVAGFLHRRIGSRAASAPSIETGSGRIIRHPWPFGWPERSFLARIVEQAARPSVLWIADPKSAPVLRDLAQAESASILLVFDAYDAWDLSPLVRGARRRSAVIAGYQAAAEAAHMVFANTPFVADRFEAWGARRVVLLPNGAPDQPRVVAGQAAERPFLVYVGRIHERVDAGLLQSVAETYPGVDILIAGPVERAPMGWQAFVRLPNVRLLGTVAADLGRSLMAGAAACLIPHVVDDYSMSQDAMKAWDAIAVGAAVVSTPVPPASTWPTELAVVATDRVSFVEAVGRVLKGEMAASRDSRLAFARDNTWAVRCRQAVTAIQDILP